MPDSIGTRVTRGSTLIAAINTATLKVKSRSETPFAKFLYPGSHHPGFAFTEDLGTPFHPSNAM
jgi:hypothetical protein